MGQLPPGAVLLVEDVAQAEALEVPDPHNLAYATQTTLSVDDTTEIVAALRRRFPAIQGPKMEDICYATTNRQAAVKAIAPTLRCAGGDRRAQLLQLHAAGRSGGQLRLPQVAPGAARRRHGLGLAGGRRAARHHRRRLGARDCWSTS